ncbi:MAG: hypothetical protein CSB44_01840 [Gammaproteobacteria bacterium]|nr:MAG: hypothetical protein CSB44_01840 [Gammaproteobacteria bacterium]
MEVQVARQSDATTHTASHGNAAVALVRLSGLVVPGRADGRQRSLGSLPVADELPHRKLRRLGTDERGIVAAVIGLGLDTGNVPMVFASRYGSMTATLALLKSLIDGEILSPTRFSMSVHNAPIGLTSLLFGNRGDHVAIAAGESTLSAALEECLGLLLDGKPEVALVYSHCALNGEYAHFDPAGTSMHVACLLRLAGADEPALPASGFADMRLEQLLDHAAARGLVDADALA